MANNILIMNTTRMGDLIQSTSVISGLRKQHKNAHISLLVSKNFAEFSKRLPHIDEIINFNIDQFNRTCKSNDILWINLYRYIESFLNSLKLKNYDLLVNLSHSKLSALMISYLKIDNICGFACSGSGDRITKNPWMQYFGIEPFNRAFNPFNLVEIFTRCVNAKPEDNPLIIKQNNSDNESISGIIKQYNIKESDILIGIQAGSSSTGRRWSPVAFAELIDGIIKQHDAKIILFGIESEKTVANKIKSFSSYSEKVIDLTGATNIGQLLTLV